MVKGMRGVFGILKFIYLVCVAQAVLDEAVHFADPCTDVTSLYGVDGWSFMDSGYLVATLTFIGTMIYAIWQLLLFMGCVDHVTPGFPPCLQRLRCVSVGGEDSVKGIFALFVSEVIAVFVRVALPAQLRSEAAVQNANALPMLSCGVKDAALYSIAFW